jgi:hypothetical protein
MLSVAQTVQCPMVGRVMNSELDSTWPNLRYYPRICVEELRKATRYLSQDSGSQDGDYYLHGRVGWRGGKAPDSCSGSTEFRSRSRYWLSWLGILLFSQAPSGKYQDCILRLGYDCFLPDPFQFMNHLTMWRYVGWIQFRVRRLTTSGMLEPGSADWLTDWHTGYGVTWPPRHVFCFWRNT